MDQNKIVPGNFKIVISVCLVAITTFLETFNHVYFCAMLQSFLKNFE